MPASTFQQTFEVTSLTPVGGLPLFIVAPPVSSLLAPTTGQAWPRWKVPRGRTTSSVTTASLGNGAAWTGTIVFGRSFRLLHIATDRAARVRVYGTTAERDADVARTTTTDPGVGSGLLLDYVTTASALSADLSPFVDGSSTEATPTHSIPITVTNLSGSAGSVTVTFTYIQTE